jgi:hypothetical protein
MGINTNENVWRLENSEVVCDRYLSVISKGWL